jgi:DNA-binding NarL/FixJ family response regulator
MINIIIIEDNETIREGLKVLIDGTMDYNCSATFSNCEDLLEKLDKLKFDILLMDIDLPGMSGIEGIKEIKKIYPESIILVLTIYEENERVFDALFAGASGYLVKKTPPARLLEAIKEAHEGGAPMSAQIARKVVNFFQQNKQNEQHDENDTNLTPREKEVLSGLVDGRSIKAIADALFISIETVRFHFRNIYRKLHVHSQSEAVIKAIKEKLV